MDQTLGLILSLEPFIIEDEERSETSLESVMNKGRGIREDSTVLVGVEVDCSAGAGDGVRSCGNDESIV